MRSGLPLSHIISFASGYPDANVTWQLLDNAGTVKSSGAIDPDPGAVSASVEVLASANTLGTGQMLGGRELLWNYTSSLQTISGSYRYQLEGQIPFLATEQGVRNMLGIAEVEDLSDEDIALVRGYLEFQNLVGTSALATFTTDSASSYALMKISEAIEAQAAWRLVPTLQVRVAKRETSGTNQYDRGDIEWDKIEARLAAKVLDAAILVDPLLDVASPSTSSLVTLVTPANDLFPDG